jgi:hypothetical protein
VSSVAFAGTKLGTLECAPFMCSVSPFVKWAPLVDGGIGVLRVVGRETDFFFFLKNTNNQANMNHPIPAAA